MRKPNGFAYVHVLTRSFEYDAADPRIDATFEIALRHREGVLRCVRDSVFEEHGEYMREEDGVVTLRLRPSGTGAAEIIQHAESDTPEGNQHAIFGSVVYIVGSFVDGSYPIDNLYQGDS